MQPYPIQAIAEGPREYGRSRTPAPWRAIIYKNIHLLLLQLWFYILKLLYIHPFEYLVACKRYLYFINPKYSEKTMKCHKLPWKQRGTVLSNAIYPRRQTSSRLFCSRWYSFSTSCPIAYRPTV